MAKISDTAYEELRLILEKQYGQTFTVEEVKEIGDGLVDFYNLLIELSKNKVGENRLERFHDPS